MKIFATLALALLAQLTYSLAQDLNKFEFSCDNIKCGLGETCYLKQVQCVQAPCPPIPQCVQGNPCLTAECNPGYRCSIIFKYGYLITFPQASCIPSWKTCSSGPCPIGTTCKTRPYFPQDGLCVPNTYGQPCQGQTCRHGELCHNQICVKLQGPICDTGSDYCDFIL